jgi:hypothetical protein
VRIGLISVSLVWVLLFARGLGACFVTIPDVNDNGTTLTPGSCGLQAPAFCEAFDAPSPGGRGGDLDEARWNVARIGSSNASQGLLNWLGSASLDACGKTATVMADHDLVVCDGQLAEVVASGVLAMRIRQPLDLTGASAESPTLLAFDVDAASDGSGWIDVWLTDQPLALVPDSLLDPNGVSLPPDNALGFFFYGCQALPNQMQLAKVYVSANGKLESLKGPFEASSQNPCFAVASGAMNHFEVRLAPTSIELWASDAGQQDTFRQVALVPVGALPLSRGYVMLEHFQMSGAQTHHWDNVGFSGPVRPTPRAIDALDSLSRGGPDGGVNLGYDLSAPNDTATVTLSLSSIDLSGAKSAHLELSLFAFDQSRTLRYCLNPPNGKCHELRSPFSPSQVQDVPLIVTGIDLSELNAGDNEIGNMKMVMQTTPGDSILSNLTLSVEVE